MKTNIAPKWRDQTSYSKNGSREPRTFQLAYGHFRLIVTRSIYNEENEWVIRQAELKIEQTSKYTEIEKAQQEAIELAAKKIESMRFEFYKAAKLQHESRKADQ
jgi:hypothetical protein